MRDIDLAMMYLRINSKLISIEDNLDNTCDVETKRGTKIKMNYEEVLTLYNTYNNAIEPGR